MPKNVQTVPTQKMKILSDLVKGTYYNDTIKFNNNIIIDNSKSYSYINTILLYYIL